MRFTIASAITLTGFALVSQVAADCNKDLSVFTQDDMATLKGCRAYNGTITVAYAKATDLSMDGIEEMTGNLIVRDSQALRSFKAPQLTKVVGDIKISNSTMLGKLLFPTLLDTKGLTMSVLPGLENIDFPAGLKNVENVHIEDTRAPTITGFQPETLKSFTLVSNQYMNKLDFNAVKEVGKLEVASNGKALDFEAQKLTTVEKASFRNLNIVSMPSLTTVMGDIMFHQNDFTALNLDKLDSIRGSLTVVNNDKLKDTSFKSLTRVGGAFSVGNNTELTSIDGFPVLEEVDGTVDIAGNIDTYFMPVLNDVRGGMRIQTSSDKIQCGELEKKLKGGNVIKGITWSCAAGMDPTRMAPTVGQDGQFGAGMGENSQNGGNNGNSGTNDAAKHIITAGLLTVPALVAMLIL
ncbi:hypothetical protein BC940DRAFT_252364 [Gongronella butleri]|nr:hypothetical protein BC940DRAFT_252364 [Gongronella butleri]